MGVAAPIAAVLLSKEGSSTNFMLELAIAASWLTAGALAGMLRSGQAGRAAIAASLMLVPMIAFDGALLAGREKGPFLTNLQLKLWGETLHLASPRELATRRQLEALLGTLPPPIYIEDDLLSQPWHSSGNRYPAPVIDGLVYNAASRAGLLQGGLDAMFRDRMFASAVLEDAQPQLPIAVRSGYRVVGTFWISPTEPLRIIVRP